MLNGSYNLRFFLKNRNKVKTKRINLNSTILMTQHLLCLILQGQQNYVLHFAKHTEPIRRLLGQDATAWTKEAF